MAPKRSDPKGRKQEYLRFLVSGRARGRKIELERNGAVGYVVNTRGMRKKGGYKGNPEEKRAYKGKSPPPRIIPLLKRENGGLDGLLATARPLQYHFKSAV